MNSIQPDILRMYLYDIGGMIDFHSWHFETEYLYKTYANKAFKDTRGFFAMVSYDFPTPRLSHLKTIRPLLRYDSMTDNCKGLAVAGKYNTDDVARARWTSGITLNMNKAFVNEIRLNYENYTNKNGFADTENKFVAEFVVRF